MTTTNAIDAIYGRAASLGRDVFHYIVTGTLFAVVCSVPWRHGFNGNTSRPFSMSVLAKQPTLHATFIERYNTLWHLRLGLAASLLSAGVFDFIVGLVWFLPVCRSDSNSAWCIGLLCCEDRLYVTNAGVVVGIVAIALGLVLMRQHLVTKMNFLARVVMAFDISEKKGQNSA